MRESNILAPEGKQKAPAQKARWAPGPNAAASAKSRHLANLLKSITPTEVSGKPPTGSKPPAGTKFV